MTYFKKMLLPVIAVCLFCTQSVQAGPKIEHWVTDKGLRVYFVPVPELPMLDAQLLFDAGSARDGDKPGLAGITSSLLDQGADGRNADQLAEAFESVGANFSASSSRDTASVSLRTLTLPNEQKTAVDTWLQVLGKPDFPQAELDNVKNLALVGLQSEKQSPAALGDKAFYKALYGDHPYGSPSNGTEESISALTRNDLQAFFTKYYVAHNAVLAIVGALDRAQAEALAEQVSLVLPAGEHAPELPAVKPLTEAKTVRIPYPSEQTHIIIGQPGNKRGDADYYSMYLGNHVLGGGGFTSRLMKEVRNDRGLSYSVYSSFQPMQQLGVFEISLQTKTAQTDEALKVVRDTLTKFRTDGPSTEELAAAVKDITGGFPLRTASNSDIAAYLAVIGFYDLPLDYLDTFTGKVKDLTREQVMDTFQRRVDPDKLLTVIVGGTETK